MVEDTPFPSLSDESSSGMWHIYVLLELNQCLLIPHQLPGDGPHQMAWIKVGVQGLMWPLTLDLSVCKLIMRGLVLYLQCFFFVLRRRPQGGAEKVSHLSWPTQLNTHEHNLGIIRDEPLTESFFPETSSLFMLQLNTGAPMHTYTHISI